MPSPARTYCGDGSREARARRLWLGLGWLCEEDLLAKLQRKDDAGAGGGGGGGGAGLAARGAPFGLVSDTWVCSTMSSRPGDLRGTVAKQENLTG